MLQKIRGWISKFVYLNNHLLHNEKVNQLKTKEFSGLTFNSNNSFINPDSIDNPVY